MEQTFIIAVLWLGLAVISTVIAHHLRVSIALVEICVGVITAAIAGCFGKADAFGRYREAKILNEKKLSFKHSYSYDWCLLQERVGVFTYTDNG